MRSVFLTLISVVVAFGVLAGSVHDGYGTTENFSDVVLIYAGNDSRNCWDMEQLAPYVTHRYSDGTERWLFDAFLFLEFVRYADNDGHRTSYGFGNGMGGDRPATQRDWEWILDEYFSIGSTDNTTTKLAALDSLIGLKKAQLGTPPFRHRVIVVCPAPKKDGTVWSTDTWGYIDGSPISLDTEANRLRAVRWYIDTLLERWRAAGFKNIDLEGIYWIEEGMISNAGIIADVNDYARSKGLGTYWIPYYRDGNEPYCERWHEDFKFDMCFFQPNYAFYQPGGVTMPITQLHRTCEAARRCGAGLEVEFETSGTSNAMHSANPQLHRHINDYMDVYEAEGVFDNAAVAYYVGSRGLNHMAESTDPVDHATIDRMASIIDARHRARYGAGGDAKITCSADSATFTVSTHDGVIQYIFKPCMANDLFTFYSVTLDSLVVNSARHSDNIGPFLLVDHGWTGGNHLNDTGAKTARTVDVQVLVDGREARQGTQYGNTMQVAVTNELLLPDGSVFAIERVKYLVAGNSIEVWCDHEYKITADVTVDRYYGMQSMCEGETLILAPGDKKRNKWIAITPDGANNAVKIKKSRAPRLSAFVERSPHVYQVTYMTADGLGDRRNIAENDFVFIGNSYGKAYHKLMGGNILHPGSTTSWHGVYSWFRQPVADTFATGVKKPVFSYPAYIGGKPATITIDHTGSTKIQAKQ